MSTPATPEGQGFPEVRGFLVTGADPLGEDPDRFAAVAEGSRRRVAVRVLPPLTEQERTAIVSLLAEFAAIEHEHLAEPVVLAADADALVLPVASQASLARLAEPPRTAGQVATALAPVASALDALHRAGLAHGAVGRDVVAIDRDGRPTLVGAGVQAVLHELAPREVDDPTPATDVAALVTMLQRAAGDTDSHALHAASTSLSSPSVSADEVARTLLEVAEPEPLGSVGDGEACDPDQPERPASAGTGGDLEPDPRPATGRTRRVGAVVAAVMVLAVIAVAVVAVFGGRGGTTDTLRVSTSPTQSAARPSAPAGPPTQPAQPTSQPTVGATPDADTDEAPAVAGVPGGVELCGSPGAAAQTTPPIPQDWASVIDELYTRRSAALVTGQQQRLCEVYDPRSPGLSADLELDTAYADQRVRPDGLVFVVEEAAVVQQQGALVVLEITDRLEPYTLLDTDGTVVAELPGLPSSTWQARLVPDPTGQEWRFG